MTHYIDADKLKKYLTDRYEVCPINDDERHGRHMAIIEIQNFIDSLQQELSEWSEEDEKTIWGLTAYIPNEELERLGITRTDILMKLKSIRPQPIQLKEAYKDGFQTARHAAALTFMNYLDENRPEGKMSLSNAECEDIDKAFKENDWEKIMRYANKYSWKPSEEQMEALKVIIDFMPDTFKPRCTLMTLKHGLEKLI